MTLLSRKADYALLILNYLHQKGGGTARAIAESLGMKPPFIANILKDLCRDGFVTSHRGVKGGYSLARPADRTTLAELLESVEDGFRLTVCNTSESHPDHENCLLEGGCALKRPLSGVHRRLLDVLRGVTLAELFDPNGELSRPSELLSLSLMPAVAAEAAHA